MREKKEKVIFNALQNKGEQSLVPIFKRENYCKMSADTVKDWTKQTV